MGARSTGSHPTTTKADGHLLEYFRQTFGAGGGGTNYVAPPLTGLTATGGVISDYTDPGPGNIYRAHIFTASGSFVVSAGGDFGDTVDILSVGGGGSGQSQNGGYGAGGSSIIGGETPGQAGYSYAGGGNGVGNNHPGKRGGDAAANSGSGGGGGRDSASPYDGGAGGSGIVLIAYPT